MKLKQSLLLPILLSLGLCSCSPSGVRHNAKDYLANTLSFKSGTDTFNILQLTDIHLSAKDNQKLQLDFLSLTINEAKTKQLDLIVMTGDVFTFADKATAERYFQFLDTFQVPWTLTFGNHDEQCYFSVTWLTSYLNSLSNSEESYCVFKDIQDDDVNGNANFYINVNYDGDLFEKLIILDSNRYYFADYMGYDYFKQNQIDWYERVINEDPLIESMMFYHIPLPEYETAYNLYLEKSPEVTYLGGSNEEGISCPKHNSGMFNKILELNSTKAMFVGHDHDNDTAFLYKGVMLAYGTNSTDRIYSKKDKIGGQLIKLKNDHTISLERIHHYYEEVEGK